MHKCLRSSGPNYHLSYHISFIIHSAIMVKARAEKLGRLITSAFGAWWTLIRPIFFHIVCSHHYSRCLRHAEHSLAPAAPTFHFIFLLRPECGKGCRKNRLDRAVVRFLCIFKFHISVVSDLGKVARYTDCAANA